jgi:cell wall-associated NlpC family hydrolase
MDKTGIILHPLVAGKAEPREQAELTTQLLYGETYSVQEQDRTWLHITNHSDAYSCWIDAAFFRETHEKPGVNKRVLTEPIQRLDTSSLPLWLPGGSRISFDANESIKKATNPIELAKKYLGSPYLWGGKTIWGMDCSGFTQVIFSMLGMLIPRDASEQVKRGKTIEFTAAIQPGDLAFFENSEGKITHVGICMDESHIIHASGEVRIDRLDHQGIFNRDQGKYTHTLRVIKRISTKESHERF